MEEAIIFRIILVFIFSLIFGIERQKAHKPISFGTFTFVAMGSCGLAITAMELGAGNPLPLLGSIVTGIGFLGAGALIKTNDKIFGFTTAASIWVFAIFGLLIGVGNYLSGILIYFLVWIVVVVDHYLERIGVGTYRKKLILKTKGINSKEKVRELFKNLKKMKWVSTDFDKEKKQVTFCYIIECHKEKLNEIISILDKSKLIISYNLE